MLPMVREAAKRVVLTLPWEDVCADIVGAPSLEIFDNRQADGTDGFSLFTVFQPQTTRLGICLRPFQANHLASLAAGQRKLANDVHDRSVFLLLGGVAEDRALRTGPSRLSEKRPNRRVGVAALRP